MIPGSGVDLDKFSQADPPESEYTTFLLIARMLWDKGVGEFVEASKNLRRRYPLARFKLLGPLGVENRTAISASQMENWINDGSVEYLGQTDDVGPFISEASCIVLPSYREGTSRVLLEAAAMGRPIVATDVPGCREVVEDQVTGFLCRPRNYLDLADKLELMLNLSTEERQAMGAKGRAKIEKEFDQSLVFDLYLNAVQK